MKSQIFSDYKMTKHAFTKMNDFRDFLHNIPLRMRTAKAEEMFNRTADSIEKLGKVSFGFTKGGKLLMINGNGNVFFCWA